MWDSLKNLGVFIIFLVFNPSKKKFDSRIELCWLVGYDLHTKAYMLFNLRTKKVITNQDVKFDETHIILSVKEQGNLIRTEKNHTTRNTPKCFFL
jgi:hypothetical protein